MIISRCCPGLVSALAAAPAASSTCREAVSGEERSGLPRGVATEHGERSHAVITGIDEAMAEVRAGAAGAVPPHLRDGHYAGAQKLGNAVGYRYPHNAPDGVLAQQYPPDGLVGRDYYRPSAHGAERALAERVSRLRRVIRGERPG